MGEGFKILVCILFVMAGLAEFGAISPSLEDNFLPDWMYAVLIFYAIWLVIVERIVPILKELYGLLKKVKDS